MAHTPNLDALETGRSEAYERYRCACDRVPLAGTTERRQWLQQHGKLCKKLTKLGWRRAWQCQKCLRSMPGDGRDSDVPIDGLPVYLLPGSPERKAMLERRLSALESYRSHLPSKREAWFKDHDLYLKTDKWMALRKAALERDGQACVKCGALAEQVHHVTYERWQNENLEDLVSLCRSCHDKEHEGG